MSLTCRLLPWVLGEGPNNMAADEALLESAAQEGVASLRFYGWTEPTVSLGYFQAAASRAQAGLDSLPWVRRPSGGAALVHHHEVTYALALPPGRAWQSGPPWLPRFHELVAEVLADFGVQVRLCRPGEERKLGEVLCFLHHTPGDLLLGSAKVAGSAQRKSHGALLQHGGILLGQSPCTPALPGIRELTGVAIPHPELAGALRERLARATGWEILAGDWTPLEHERRQDLLANRYRSPAWNEKR
jgi:lipoate-protein ligase A